MEEDIKEAIEYLEKRLSLLHSNYQFATELAIENLIKGYRELEERNKELYKTCCKYEDTLGHYENKIFDELDDYIKLDEISKLDKIGIKGKKYISESLIKEKIEEVRNSNGYSPVNKIFIEQVLEELLNTKM